MKSMWILLLILSSCGKGSTGSSLVKFTALSSGPSDAPKGPLTFTSGSGAAITLTRAKLHLGAVYLNQSVPTSGSAAGPCILPGIYVAEAYGPMDVDLLSPDPVPFPSEATATETLAKTAEIWLTGGDINAEQDATIILDVAGSAIQQGITYPFVSSITISGNRKPKISNPALPGANPICHQRIVTPIAVDLTPKNQGTLLLQIDPRPMFNAIDFATAQKESDAPLLYRIVDDTTAKAGGALFKGMIANSGVYKFTWKD
jgi:hypothetical protein